MIQTLANVPSTLPIDASTMESSISALKSSISALESSLKTLEGASGYWETLAWWCAIAVGIGIVGEIVVIVGDYRDDLTAWRRGIVCAPDHPNVKRYLFDIFATIVVLLGVFGEAGASMELASINSQLRSKTSELRAKSDQLLALTTELAGNADLIAERERIVRVEAEESAEWRRISPRQEGQLKRRLVGFEVAKTWFVYDMYNVEAFSFGRQIASALSAPLHWNPTEPEPIMRMREGPVPLGTNPPLETGVTVSTTGKQSDENAANALVRTLISLGFDCRRSSKPALNDPQAGPTVFVFIDLRPEGRQGEAKLEAGARTRLPKMRSMTSQ